MKFKAKLLVVLVVIVSVGLAACAVTPAAPTPVPPTPSPVPPTPTPVPPTPTPSITVEDLTGIWKNPDAPQAVQFNEDGTYRQGAAQALETFFTEVGRFQLEGTVITFLTDEGRVCGVGQSGSYQVELTEPDLFQLVLQEDACQSRANYYPGTWNRVETTPSITVQDLTGIWRNPWGMHLKLNEDGTYRFGEIVARLETLPSELGRFELEGTTFTFITSNESPACTGQTGSYQVELTEQGKLRFVPLQEDPCQWRARNAHSAWEQVEP